MEKFELSGNNIIELDWVEAVILNKEEVHIETIEGLIQTLKSCTDMIMTSIKMYGSFFFVKIEII